MGSGQPRSRGVGQCSSADKTRIRQADWRCDDVTNNGRPQPLSARSLPVKLVHARHPQHRAVLWLTRLRREACYNTSTAAFFGPRFPAASWLVPAFSIVALEVFCNISLHVNMCIRAYPTHLRGSDATSKDCCSAPPLLLESECITEALPRI